MQTPKFAYLFDELLEAVLVVKHHQAFRAQIRKYDVAEKVIVSRNIGGIVAETGRDLLQEYLDLSDGRNGIDEVSIREIVFCQLLRTGTDLSGRARPGRDPDLS